VKNKWELDYAKEIEECYITHHHSDGKYYVRLTDKQCQKCDETVPEIILLQAKLLDSFWSRSFSSYDK